MVFSSFLNLLTYYRIQITRGTQANEAKAGIETPVTEDSKTSKCSM